MKNQKIYRMGFKISNDNIAWAIVDIDENGRPENICDFGLRVFPAGIEKKNKIYEPRNRKRQIAKRLRKNRDRYLQRRKKLLNYMINIGIQPNTEDERKKLSHIDPWQLRDEAAEKKITLFELGRALFHINQRRGYQSNRLIENNEIEEKGLLEGITTFQKELINKNITVGQFLNRVNKSTGKCIRLRYDKTKNWSDRFISRNMMKNEFNIIMKKQMEYYPKILTEDIISNLHTIIFHQRPMKPVDIGLCTLLGNKTYKKMGF